MTKAKPRVVLILFLSFWLPALWAAEVTIKNFRMWEAPDRTRIVLDLSAPHDYQHDMLADPHRLYIDLENARLGSSLPRVDSKSRFLAKVHSGAPRPGILRIVFTMKSSIEPKIFLLKPNEVYGDRLVIDLYGKTTKSGQPTAKTQSSAKAKTKFIVAIDAGHGGEDPGAIGKRGTREKHITLAVAKELKRIVDSDPDMQGVLIRKGDYYVGLRRRTAIARSEQADLFVSIHADAFPQRSVRGSSLYTLSGRGASSETARWLSDRENAADLVGGVSLKDKDQVLAQVLLDLSMTKAISDSRELGKDILSQLGRIGKLHSRRVEYAGFAVLKSPDIPSVLVETAFLSNPQEENLLRTESHRRKIANAIYQGVRTYYQRRTPGAKPVTYVVQRGDTLSGIAQRFRITVSSLKRTNNLKSDVVRIGQTLRLR